jgi:hypothetical protein
VTNQHLKGFCALSAPVQLQRLWFATPPSQKPKAGLPHPVLTERMAHTKFKSNTIAIP